MPEANAMRRQPSEAKKRVFWGSFVHAVSNRQLEYWRDTLLAVDENGTIAFIQHDVATREDVVDLLRDQGGGWEAADVVHLAGGEFIIPGLIDTHTHAPQYPNLGRGQQYQLLDWLSNLTFPTEARFADPVYAEKTYESVVNRVISAGTTTCCWYGTLHLDATKTLASIVHRRGQRAFVGKCNMDRHSAPDYVEKGAAQSIADTKEFIKYVRTECCSSLPVNTEASTYSNGGESALTVSPPTSPRSTHTMATVHSNRTPYNSTPTNQPTTGGIMRPRSSTSGSSASSSTASSTARTVANQTALVQPILTPRFAISCSDALMAALQAMVGKDPMLHIQTHLAENPAEIEFTKQLFPFADTYTQVYEHFGLLTNRTVLAHCVHLEDEEMDLIKRKGSGISHCPTSNLNLRSGCSPVAELLDRGIKVGLGTDVSGGFGMGILTALREASVVSKVLAFSQQSKVDKDKARGRSLTPKKHHGLPIVEDQDPSTNSTSESSTANANGWSSDAIPFSGKHLPLETLFFLATLGGAQVCDLQDRIGNFVVGKEFDALLIKTGQKSVDYYGDEDVFSQQLNPALFVEPDDELEAVFEKFLFAGDDRNIASVFVRGRVIGGSAPLA